MKKIMVKRQASIGHDGVYFRYSLWRGDKYIPLNELWKYFPSLTSKDVREIVKNLIDKWDIEPACLGSLICDVREKTPKSKKVIRKKHKKIMCFYRELLENLEELEKEKSLTDWLWPEKYFKL